MARAPRHNSLSAVAAAEKHRRRWQQQRAAVGLVVVT